MTPKFYNTYDTRTDTTGTRGLDLRNWVLGPDPPRSPTWSATRENRVGGGYDEGLADSLHPPRTLQGDRDPDIPGAGEDPVGAHRELLGFPVWPRFPLREHGPHDAQPHRVGDAAELGQGRLDEVGFLRRAGNWQPLEQHRHVRMSASGRTCQCLYEQSSSLPVRDTEGGRMVWHSGRPIVLGGRSG